MIDSARKHFRLSVTRAWRDAWRIAESNPLLLLLALVVFAGAVEGCARIMGAIVKSFPAAEYGLAASWLVYIAMIALNQLIIAGLSAGIALLMLMKSAEDGSDSLQLRRGPVLRYFFRVSVGWLGILFATQIVSVPANIALASLTVGRGELPFESPIYLLSSIVFAVLEGGIASLFFLGLPNVLAGVPPQPRRGARASFFIVCCSLYLATGLSIGLIWIFWFLKMDYADSMRFIDWKNALDGWWVLLLSFAASRQFDEPHPSLTSVFD